MKDLRTDYFNDMLERFLIKRLNQNSNIFHNLFLELFNLFLVQHRLCWYPHRFFWFHRINFVIFYKEIGYEHEGDIDGSLRILSIYRFSLYPLLKGCNILSDNFILFLIFHFSKQVQIHKLFKINFIAIIDIQICIFYLWILNGIFWLFFKVFW